MQRYERDFHTPRLLISSALIVLVSFFYVFSVGTSLDVGIFPLEDGSINYKSFNTFVFDQFIDSLLISIFTIVWFATALLGKAKTISLLIYGALTLAAFATNISALVYLTTLISLPVIILILIC